MKSNAFDDLKDRLRQHQRAGLPFNPLVSEAITGANVGRLQASMESFGWKDHRFVTEDQAKRNGWVIPKDANSVHVTERDPVNGSVVEKLLFNASSLIGMPTLEEMLGMSERDFSAMRGESPEQSVKVQHSEKAESDVAEEAIAEDLEEEGVIHIGPALAQQPNRVGEAIDAQPDLVTADEQVTAPFPNLVRDEPVEDLRPEVDPARSGIDWSAEPNPHSTEYAVEAQYWLDGLHNFEGLKQADEINRLISQKKLTQDKHGVENLLSTYPDKSKLGLSVVEKEQREMDPIRKANQAEPVILLKGALVRDREGKYRPKEGGSPIIEDQGTSLKLNRKHGKAYEAAMELALAKGWKVIELAGKPNMMSQAWLEAKMQGLEVVNYIPTEKDREALAQRMSERAAALAKEQGPETVVMRPVMDSDGQQVMANVTYTVEEQRGKVSEPAAAGQAQQPTVIRTTTRVNDVVRTEVQQGVAPKAGRNSRKPQNLVEQEVAEAIAEDKAEEVGGFGMPKVGTIIDQGNAPFQHMPKAKSSHFVILKNEQGQTQTVWGADLPRSLGEAGAKLGDTISLKEQERKPVDVSVDLPEGGKKVETFSRVTWATTILEKAKSIHEPSVAQQVVDSGNYIGPVMEIKNGFVGQKAGRDPNNLVWHEISKLQGKVPEIGEMAEIGYSQGQGKVKNQELQRSLER